MPMPTLKFPGQITPHSYGQSPENSFDGQVQWRKEFQGLEEPKKLHNAPLRELI